jgi:Alr-MurF fusion protein
MYTISLIEEVIGGRFLQCPSPGYPVGSLLIDSRQMHQPEHTLFFAFKGVRQDGHRYLDALYRQGVRNFIISRVVDLSGLPEANVLLVGEVLEALQALAAYHRSQFKIPVIGITGSNGKTIVKEWLYQLLCADYHIVKSPKSYNSQIGVPLSVWQLNDRATLGIFEAGISQPGEMDRLENMIRPDIGIMTNLGSAHALGFAQIADKLDEKLRLFRRCHTIICCRDQVDVFNGLVERKLPLFTWSFGPGADLQVTIEDQTGGYTLMGYRTDWQQGQIRIPYTDPASIENAVHCLCLIKVLQPDNADLDRSFEQLLPIEMRLEALDGINGCMIINDVYNADLESLSVALAFANFQSKRLKKTVILSDLLQQPDDPGLYRRVAELLKQNRFEKLYGVGSQIQGIKPYLDSIQAEFFQDTDAFMQAVSRQSLTHELILIKGARAFGLERVTELLSLKKHQTVLEINLAALARNLKVFENHLNDGKVKMMAMVKAAAYGSGGVEIARFLESRHIDYLAVAYVDEGVELRQAGIETPILVLNADTQNLANMMEYNLEPEIYSPDQLREVIGFAELNHQKVPLHLKLETGMNRLGIEEKDIGEVIRLVTGSSVVMVKSIFSHLAASEDENERPFTQMQIRKFTGMAQRISENLQYRPLWHLANSNAIVNYPEAQFDMVRIGIGMYGIGMSPSLILEPVHTLKTFISQIREIPPGSTVGYGRREKVGKPLKIATIAIGYADGLIRKAGNRRYAVVVNGRKAPIAGSICMDMTMIDVTGIEDVSLGTEVTIFGKDPTISELALAAETIPYEVFTSLSSRVKRIYVYD